MRRTFLNPLLRDLKQLAGVGPAGWFDLIRASAELAIARLKLGARTASDLLQAARDVDSGVAVDPLSDEQLRLVRRVSFAVPRVGPRLPWRADCLVQALAAQRWLRRSNIPTDLFIGVRNQTPAGFEAHAWLMLGDMVITGGEIEGYTPLLTPQSQVPRQGSLWRGS